FGVTSISLSIYIYHMFRVFLLILLSGCIFSCASTESSVNSSVEVIRVGESFANKGNVNLSRYATSVEYIPLETLPQSVLTSVKSLRLRVLGDKVYIFDKNATLVKPKWPVLCFNSTGKFMHSVGVLGNSEKECMNIKDVIVNDVTDEVIIVDRAKFLFYTPDGEYKRTADVIHNGLRIDVYSFGANRYVYFKSPSLLDENQSHDVIVFLDSLGKSLFKRRMLRMIVRQKAFGKFPEHDDYRSSSLYSSESNLTLYSCKDSIYSINPINGELQLKYFVDFGEYATKKYDGAQLYSLAEGYFDTDAFIAMKVLFTASSFQDMDEHYRWSNVIYDKETKTTTTLKYNSDYGIAGFTNDLDGSMPFYPAYVKDGKMYQMLDAIDFIEYAEISNSAKMKEVAATLTEESNPVMVVVMLR
ncbi:MAG: 6-bladed beta-propeller, partial [Bacteroidales bacterium]|nr:6-bladed beta-propeller [Bacteroidales bacterium]